LYIIDLRVLNFLLPSRATGRVFYSGCINSLPTPRRISQQKNLKIIAPRMKRERLGGNMLGFIKRFLPLLFARIVLPVFALAVVSMALPQRANAQALFATSKNICIGVPDPNTNNPNTCPTAAIVGVGQPVFYVIQVTNPPGQPPQQITLTENYPAGFFPTAGAIACTDLSGATVTFAINGPVIGPFNLPLDTMITCTIPGTFNTTPGLKNNVVDVDNRDGPAQHPSIQTTLATTTQLATDLAVTKTVSPSPIGNIANPLPATVTYTATIKNNGPVPVDVGQWFVLHDTLALLPGGMPLYATVVAGSFTCMRIPATTDCLDTAAMNAMSWTQQLIGTMAPHSMFDWSFPSSPTLGFTGHIDVGGTITLTWKVLIEKLPTLSCVKSTTANGLLNRAFFTLTNPAGTAANDINNANNTASASLPVTLTGTVDPNCGDGQLTIKKTQVTPPPGNQVPWGMPTWPPTQGTVTYDITIKNTAMPAQAITITGTQLKDFVIEGIGTPPFTRTFVSAVCINPSTGSICAGFAGNPPPPAPFPSIATQTPYTFYGQQQLGWNTVPATAIVLNPGDFFTIRIKFNYYGPDCETVPNVNPKLIDNKAQLTYMATAVGAAVGSPQNVQYTQVAIAHTLMAPQQACKFVVTKVFHPGSPKIVQFGGPPVVYDVTFTNNEPTRTIGTVMDSVRITDPAYATQVPFKSSWVCTQTGGVSPLPVAVPPVNGTAIYTGSPAQGAPVFQFTNLKFGNGAQLKCTVTITVDRPLPNNPHCSMNQAYFENMALMDVTNPFNTNVPWPPSGVYNAAVLSNPTPQNRNWATLQLPLPKCYNFNVNKAASVNGITTNAWTSPTGPAVNYTIQVTNTGTSGTLTGSGALFNWNGLLVGDVISPPYGTNPIKLTIPSSCPGPWCTPLVPVGSGTANAATSLAGVANLAAGGFGIWALTLLPTPNFTAGIYIDNCASVAPAGTFLGPDYYSNYDPANPPPKTCVKVPVLPTTKLGVTKIIVNETGHALNMPSTSSGMNVTCQAYPLLSTGNLAVAVGGALALANGGSLTGTGQILNVPVAANETCTVTEPAPPAISPGACGKDTVAYWDTTISPQPVAITAAGPNAVTVTNRLRCRPTLSVTKTFVDATGSSTPIQPPAFIVNVTCGPLAITPTNLTLTPPATATSSSALGIVQNIPVGAGQTCTVTEPVLPPIPPMAQKICGNTAYWDSSPAYSPAQTIPVTASGPLAVNVTNTLRCKVPPQTKIDGIKHVVDMTPGGANHPASPYNVTLGCNPLTAPTNVNLTEGVTDTVLASLGATCTPSEVPPPVPVAAAKACTGPAGAVGSAYWETPAFIPPSFTVTSAGPQLVHVFNVLRCGIKDSPGTLTVLKQVSGPAGIVPPPTAFPISVQCGTLPPTHMTLNAGGSQTVVASLQHCTVSETVPPKFPTKSCPSGAAMWLPPVYAPASAVTVPLGTAVAVTVTNSYACIPPGGGPVIDPAINSPAQ
jgi:hypothetical protein